MKVRFNINYITSFGEELFVSIWEDEHPGRQKSFGMLTNNGQDWYCEINVDKKNKTWINYHYSVKKNGKEVRCEWLTEAHRLCLPTSAKTMVNVYDKWTVIPEDVALYSTALRGNRQLADDLSVDTSRGCTLVLKVRAPQLRSNERLALIGDDPYIGNWEALKAKEMKEQQPHEWSIVLDVKAFSRPLIEFKFVALDEEHDVTPLWEEGRNRTVLLPHLASNEMTVYELTQASLPIYPWKGAGTVIPVFSLRSEGSFGVGDFGDLKAMIDWAAMTGQRALQVLPINDTTITHTWQDSYPYNSISIYALHPQYTDLRQLPPLKDEQARLHYESLRHELNALTQIDYERVNEGKMSYLRALYEQEGANIKRKADYKSFVSANKEWLLPYAVYSVCRDTYGTASFSQWPEKVKVDTENETITFTPRNGKDKERKVTTKDKTLGKQLAFWYFIQYNLDKQMRAAHEHAMEKHVILKGDIPIGISRDGVEAWMEPRYFNLNGQAGAPPDAFSRNGQNWGFPTYNWKAMIEDGCSWWVKRFTKMAQYFDAYRIDHVLGFFRIWEIPIHAVHGLLGQFSPALPMTREEIEAYGLNFQEDLFTEPYIRDWMLDKMFGEKAGMVKTMFLDLQYEDVWKMKKSFNTQRKIEAFFKEKIAAGADEQIYNTDIRDGLYALVSNVLFVRDHNDSSKFHPRIGVQLDYVYESLYDCDKFAFNRLYNDYFYRRNNHFWYGEAMKKLPLLTQATRMLVCAEDLGMVPDCVPWVMNELRILSLEIQSMPKDSKVRFGHLSQNPYRSVCTISTHDMPTLRQWWDEDNERTQDYYVSMLHRREAAPHPLPGWLAKEIVSRHLTCPSMLCLLSFQDWLAIDEKLRLPDENAERINIPANPRHYWRYRMHLTIEQLMKEKDFNDTVKTLIFQSGRA